MINKLPVVAVTGASGYIGCRLLHELEEEQHVAKVVAIDTMPLPIPFHKVTSERLDVSFPLASTFRDRNVDTVVHLAFILKPGRNRREIESIRHSNVNGVKSVLNACLTAKVKNFIYLSSHTVYGAHKDNPVPLTERAALRPSPGFQYGVDKFLCEKEVQKFANENPTVRVTILRSCLVMGPGADNYVTRAFFKPLLLGVRGYDPPLQFVHEDDLAKLLRNLILQPCSGTFNVAGDGVVHYSRMAQLSRKKILFLPSTIAFPLTQMTWTLGIQKDAPASGLDFIRHSLIVSTGKLKSSTGFRFFYSSEDALMAYVASDNT